jgi:hypothetical protein
VLQPASHLYYFTSPEDTEPRGCINLEQAQIIDISPVAFALQLGNRRRCHNTETVVELQANTPTEAITWKHALASERYQVLKQRIRKIECQNDAYRSRHTEMQQQFQHNIQLIEHDRDGAMQDAKQWKHKYDTLQEAIRKFTLQLRRTTNNSPKPQTEQTTSDSSNHPNTTTTTEEHTNDNHNNDDKPPELLEEEDDTETDIAMDMQNIPGAHHFSALYNAVLQIQENLHLASREAEMALDDVRMADERRRRAELRTAEMETHACQLWEENATLRKSLQQKKREKRVLVREVKHLRRQQIQQQRSISNNNNIDNNNHKKKSPRKQPQPQPTEPKEQTEITNQDNNNSDDDDDDEDRLLTELEEHVESSLKLHQEFLAANTEIQAQLGGRYPSFDRSIQNLNDALQSLLIDSSSTTSPREPPPPSTDPSSIVKKHPPPPIQMASLFHDDDDEDNDDDSDSQSNISKNEQYELAATATRSSSVSSVMAEASGTEIEEQGHPDVFYHENDDDDNNNIDDDDDLSSVDEDRPNPLLQMDAKEKGDDSNRLTLPRLCATSSLSESSASRTTILRDNKATSKLSCPLADVVNTNRENHVDPKLVEDVDSDNQIYHLTFYSRRIGLQFQKVPPPPRKANGLLTEAMTADLMGVSDAADKTAAELRRIASISNETMDQEKMTLEVASPMDAVLVCGFEGFDDSGTNVRPKLGARLVAFDGISVEIGNWTFDAVRKAIQARPRPLTLSFRNDFLTTEQRRILTKAIQEVKEKSRPVERTKSSRSIGTEPSTQSSKSGDLVVQQTKENQSVQSHEDDLSVSAASSDYYRRPVPQSFSGGRSVSSGNFRSFSEAGSSVSVLSAVGPLVSNLLQHGGRLREPFTPEYLRRAPEYVEATPQHQDFKAGLL